MLIKYNVSLCMFSASKWTDLSRLLCTFQHWIADDIIKEFSNQQLSTVIPLMNVTKQQNYLILLQLSLSVWMTFHFCLSLGNMLLLTISSLLHIQTIPLVMQTSWLENTAVHGMPCHDLKTWQPGDRKREKVLNLSTLHSIVHIYWIRKGLLGQT